MGGGGGAPQLCESHVGLVGLVRRRSEQEESFASDWLRKTFFYPGEELVQEGEKTFPMRDRGPVWPPGATVGSTEHL